jgi:hypothetical protein
MKYRVKYPCPMPQIDLTSPAIGLTFPGKKRIRTQEIKLPTAGPN